MDIPRIFNITESAHRIHNPITPEKLATLAAALRLESGARVLDLGSGSGEMLCTWARDHGVIGTGIDMSQLFTEQAKLRAVELGVADQVKFIHGDAAGYVSDEKASVAACVGATWIAGGVVGTIELLARSLRTGGIILIGEPYWRQLPPTEDVAKGCLANSISDFLMLPELLASFGHLGYDVVEMVLADQDGWDRYEAANRKNGEMVSVRLKHRLATQADLAVLRTLMDASITELQKPFLDPRQIESSRMIMGLDTQLIDDGTYLIVEESGEVVGCGGWSRRATLYGGDQTPGRNAALLDPKRDPAKVRAMYTHPAHARKGIGRLILSLCEKAARAEGFLKVELMATMAGEPLYLACGYQPVARLQDERGGAAVPLIRMQKEL
jgi:SAM-dependent methyltransferase/GNAT superfamily N-acetyltransferase